MPGAVAGAEWGHPVGIIVVGRMIRDAAGPGPSSMLGSGMVGTGGLTVEQAGGAGTTGLPKIQEL